MGNLGLKEILLVGLGLVILFGSAKLPQLGRSLGDGIREFKKATREPASAR